MTKRVYIVDDDPDMVKVLNFRLKGAGFDVIAYTSGKDAFEAIKSSPPDLVLLDVQMPDMTGKEIAEGIAANEPTKDIPVIFLTGKVDFDESLVNGNNKRAMIIKPCNFDELTQKINEMTGG